jgi:transposase-like protein
MKYSAAFKTKMVQKLLGGRSVNSVAQEVGVNQPTLSKWLRDARTLPGVTKRKASRSLERAPDGVRRIGVPRRSWARS